MINLFKKKKTVFIDKHGNGILFKEYLPKDNMLIRQTPNGLEKIPTDGLFKKEVK